MTREQFQEEHGRQLAQILSLPAFNAAMFLLSLEITEGIARLDDSQIKDNAAIILADIRGRLRHEKAMLTLPVITTDEMATPLAEEYVDQAAEAFEQFKRNHHQPNS